MSPVAIAYTAAPAAWDWVDCSARLHAIEDKCFKTRSGCWIYPTSETHTGYTKIAIIVDGKQQQWLVHRLVWALAKGPIPDGLFVCHTCDIRTCVSPDHLWLGTCEQNQKDRVRKGRAGAFRRDGRPNARRAAEIPKDVLRGWERIAWFEWRDGAGDRIHPDTAKWPGVYAIWHQARLLYIGYSKNVHVRVRKHLLNVSGRSKDFPTHVTAMQCLSAKEAASLESILIRTHLPPNNIRIEPPGGQVRTGTLTLSKAML